MNKKYCSICDHRGEYDGTPICKKGATLTDAINYIKAPYCPFPDKKDKTPTLEEVKKEWEALGWSWSYKTKYVIYLSRNNTVHRVFDHITINENRLYSADFDIDIKTHQLLTKTFKALGWFE